MTLPLRQIGLFLLLLLLCAISAFAVIYCKDVYQKLYAKHQTQLATQRQAKVTWSKLLLEQSTLVAEPRIQQIASKKLGMVVPRSNQIKIIKNDS